MWNMFETVWNCLMKSWKYLKPFDEITFWSNSPLDESVYHMMNAHITSWIHLWLDEIADHVIKSLVTSYPEQMNSTRRNWYQTNPHFHQFPKVSIPSAAGCHGAKSSRFGLSLRGRSVTQASGAGSHRICSTRMHVWWKSN